MYVCTYASDSVGCAWQVRAISSEDAPYSIANTSYSHTYTKEIALKVYSIIT